uniref:Uncharacterized protein n=1 Tax=Tetranychus urticae TaxID=32264 RepID=T1JUD0_TETUR
MKTIMIMIMTNTEIMEIQDNVGNEKEGKASDYLQIKFHHFYAKQRKNVSSHHPFGH